MQEHHCAFLTQDLPDAGLKADDIGTVVRIHKGGAGYEVEFVTLVGETRAATTLRAQQFRPIARGEIAQVREAQTTLSVVRESGTTLGGRHAETPRSLLTVSMLKSYIREVACVRLPSLPEPSGLGIPIRAVRVRAKAGVEPSASTVSARIASRRFMPSPIARIQSNKPTRSMV